MRAENAKQYHIMAHHIISYHIISYHVISCYVMSYHIISYHIISYHISCHIISYHTHHLHIMATENAFSQAPYISPNPRPDEETRQSTDHLCFSLKEKSLKICNLKVPSLRAGHFEEITALMLINKLDVFAMRETWLNHTWREPKSAIDGNTTPDVIELTPKGEEQRFTQRTR